MFRRQIILFLLYMSAASLVSHAETPPAAAVATAHPLATRAGEEILSAGGNAFDAAAAVSAALAVVEPAGSGLGGGGFWLLYRASDNKEIMIDGREKAPALAHRNMYLDENNEVIKTASRNGPLAAGIPGVPAGIVYLAEKYGNLPLEKILVPAIRYAADGYEVTRDYQKKIKWRQGVLKSYPEASRIFLQDDKVPQIGHLIIQKDMARTLKKMASEGKDGFYSGEVAEKLVTSVNKHDGIWSLKDLAEYSVVERKPIIWNYRGIRVVSASPPSSGGIVLSQALTMLEQFEISEMNRIAKKHYIIEAMRRAYRDRAVYLGDPDFVDVPTDRLLNRDYLSGLALTINPKRATPSVELGDTPGLAQAGTQTTHFSVLDAEGNRVAASLSNNFYFGSGFVATGTGILLNNEMDDFSAKENVPNAYELIGGHANSIAPGKRPLSSMTPTFLESPDRVGIVGTPGGSRIISMVLLATLDFAEGRLPGSWVSLPRFHHQYEPDVVLFEQFGLTPGEQKALEMYGHKLKARNSTYGNMQAILWDKKNKKVYAASDPRGEGEATVINVKQ